MLFEAGCAVSRAEKCLLIYFFLKKLLFLELKSMFHNVFQGEVHFALHEEHRIK